MANIEQGSQQKTGSTRTLYSLFYVREEALWSNAAREGNTREGATARKQDRTVSNTIGRSTVPCVVLGVRDVSGRFFFISWLD